jgi:protein ImuB
MVACVLIPRFTLVAALGERRGMLGSPVALAPEPGGAQVIGEVSGAAEAFGLHAGMRLGEALARCPSLGLVAPDPDRAEETWEEVQRRLEGIGAAVESARPGEAFFEADALRPLWGSIEAVLRRARRALGRSARLGAGPGRLCAQAAAERNRPRRPPVIVPEGAGRAFLAPLPVGMLRERFADEWERPGAHLAAPGRAAQEAASIESLERLGVRTLGELAALPDDAVADRFGEAGLRALEMARGADVPLRPRRGLEALAERLELPEGCSGTQLERALALLLDRLLARRARRGRTVRKLRLAARLSGGGSWSTQVTLRQASADRARLALALVPKLEELPGPAAVLSVRALELGPADHDQQSLTRSPGERRRERLAEAVRQVRAAAGRDAVLRVLEVEPDSRVPERRAIFTPYE